MKVYYKMMWSWKCRFCVFLQILVKYYKIYLICPIWIYSIHTLSCYAKFLKYILNIQIMELVILFDKPIIFRHTNPRRGTYNPSSNFAQSHSKILNLNFSFKFTWKKTFIYEGCSMDTRFWNLEVKSIH